MKGKRSAQITLLFAGAAAIVSAGCQRGPAPTSWKTESDCIAETGSPTNCVRDAGTGHYHGTGIYALPYRGGSSWFSRSSSTPARSLSSGSSSSRTGSSSSVGSVSRGGFGSTGSHFSSHSSS